MKTNNKNYDLNVLKADTLREFKAEYKNYDCIDSALHEIADSNVPIYNYDLVQYLANNSELAYSEEQEEIKDIYSFLMTNIFHELHNFLCDYVANKKRFIIS
tara:strand:+ start:381 stop:686 length:306 start_codon:yes stop_codon:yes gene_type:complete